MSIRDFWCILHQQCLHSPGYCKIRNIRNIFFNLGNLPVDWSTYKNSMIHHGTCLYLQWILLWSIKYKQTSQVSLILTSSPSLTFISLLKVGISLFLSLSYLSFLCCLRSIAAHRDHFVQRLCVKLSWKSHIQSCNYISQVTHAFLRILLLCSP